MIEELFFFSDVIWRIFRKILGGVKTSVFVSKKSHVYLVWKNKIEKNTGKEWNKKKDRTKKVLQKGMNKWKRSFFQKNRGDFVFFKKVSQKKKNTNRRNMRESQ